jgi:hypothetical protein
MPGRPQSPRIILSQEFRAALAPHTYRVLANAVEAHESALAGALAAVAIPATPLALA